MGKALEVITVQATAPGAGAIMAAVAGNSLTIRDSKKPINILAWWQQRQAAGWSRITSPLMHDSNIGIQGGGPIGHSTLLRGFPVPIYGQDTLSMMGSGSAVAGDIEQTSILVAYDDVPGADAHLITAGELRKRIVDLHSFQNTLATGVAGGYSGSELITAEADNLKANTEYAILGANVQVGCSTIRWVGPDFSNLGVGMPGATADFRNQRYFLDLAESTGRPCIPVFSSANKSLTFLDAATDENGVDPIVQTLVARLS